MLLLAVGTLEPLLYGIRQLHELPPHRIQLKNHLGDGLMGCSQVVAELGIVEPHLGEHGRDGGVVLHRALEVEELPLDREGNVAAIDPGVGPVVDGGEGEGSVVTVVGERQNPEERRSSGTASIAGSLGRRAMTHSFHHYTAPSPLRPKGRPGSPKTLVAGSGLGRQSNGPRSGGRPRCG